MTTEKHPAEALAAVPPVLRGSVWCTDADAMLRRIPAMEAEIARLTAALDDAHAAESVAQVAIEAVRADAERWREMRRVFHVTAHIGRTTGMPATKISAHWHGWASGDHADVTGCVDALINERPAIDAAREAQP